MSGEGGFWNAPKVVYSKQTHDLLKDMMRESKLTTFQQRQLQQTLRDGGNLPSTVPPTTSKINPTKQKQVSPLPKVLNPKVYSGGVRSKNTMEAMGAFEKPEYVPVKGVTRSVREKERLANIMAFGEDKPKVASRKVIVDMESPPPPPDRFEELQNEIEDRQRFLQEMVAIGKGDKYRPIIATEISQLVREMELIDKKRSGELQKLLELEEKQRNISSQGLS
ncbi:UPF0193 protein [Biomphalaria glabrata]|nr:UPF0193 protein EVG1-like [Biomphalaria glabrata]KAI8797400.1 UPF0193 protein EVG1 [Biomphalaria glabrata]